MKTHILNLVAVMAVLISTACRKEEKAQQPGTADPAAPTPSQATPQAAIPAASPFTGGRKTSFQEVTSQLDPGGSLFVYLATDQWLAGLSTNIAQFQQILWSIPGPGNREGIEQVLGVLVRMVKTSGIEAITGIGLSAAPVAPGLFRNKIIVHHPSGAASGVLGSLFGQTPHLLQGQSMLPTNTALAFFGDLDIKPLWQTLQRELEQVPEAQEAMRNWPQTFEQQTRIPWAALLESLGGEVGMMLTLDDTQSIDLPMGRGTRISMPAPGLLVAVKVNNTLLYDRLSGQLQSNPKAVTTEAGGVKICSLPMPAPLPLELTVASSGDYLYLASAPQLVSTVQAVRQGQQPGLKNSAAFAELARHLPSQGNQFIYVAQSFGATFAELQQQVMGETGMQPDQLELLQRVLGDAKSSHSLAISAHTPTGWQLVSVGNKDSASAAVLAPTIGITAIGAGLLLPALAKAKAKAQTVSTVNNLKQLGLAARMYSNDNQECFPKAESWCDDLKKFLPNPKLYKAANDPSPRPCSFAYNAKLSGLSETKINPQTVLFFETDEGEWNQSGGPELLIARPRGGGAYTIGFADGSVQMLQASRVSALRWDP